MRRMNEEQERDACIHTPTNEGLGHGESAFYNADSRCQNRPWGRHDGLKRGRRSVVPLQLWLEYALKRTRQWKREYIGRRDFPQKPSWLQNIAECGYEEWCMRQGIAKP